MAFNLKLVLKALLFSSSQPLTIKDIQGLFTRYHDLSNRSGTIAAADPTSAEVAATLTDDEGIASADPSPLLSTDDAELYAEVPALVTATQIREAMDDLAADLKASNDIYLLIDGAQGYRIVTLPRFARWIRVLRDEPPPLKLTQSALETLAVVAYRQPVTRSEVEAIRGVTVEGALSRLLERELVYIVGRADLPGRPLQYGTTDRFLEFIGIKSLVELPASDVLSPRQIDEWLNHAAVARPPADAEMGLPLEEGEGTSPSLEPVVVEHVDGPPAASVETPASDQIRATTTKSTVD